MRILSINDYNGLVGGTEVGTKALCEELVDEGHSVVYLGCGEGNFTEWGTYSLPLLDGTENINKRSIIDKIKIGKRWNFFQAAYDNTIDIVDKEKPDIAHLHNIFYQLSIAPVVALKKKKIPFLMTVHDHRIYCPRGTLLTNKGRICKKMHASLGCASCIGLGKAWFATKQYNRVRSELRDSLLVAPSVFIADRLNRLGFNNVVYLHYGTKNLGKYVKPKGNSFAYVGRITKSKGLFLLIDAVKDINADFRLNIVGTGPAEENLRKYVKELGLDNKVKVLGKKSHKESLRIIQNSLFVVIPSMWVENTPQVVFETMGLGRTIIAADIGGLPDLVKNERTGLLFNVGDIGQLKVKINELLVNRNKLERLSKNAFGYAKKEFYYDKYVKHVLNYYKRIML